LLVGFNNRDPKLKRFAASLHSSQSPFPEKTIVCEAFLTNRPITSETLPASPARRANCFHQP